MEKYKKFVWDIGLIGAANILNNFKSFLIIPLLTKYLGAYNYGAWTQVKVTLTFLIPFFTFGAGQAIVKFLAGETDKAKIREDYLSCLFTTLGLSLLVALCCFNFSTAFSVLIFGNKEFEFLTKVFAVLLVLESANAILLEYFRAFKVTKIYFNILFLETIFELGIIAYVVFRGYGVLGAVLGLLISRLLFVAARAIQVQKNIGFSIPRFVHLRNYMYFGLPLVFSSLFFFILNWGNRYFINYFLGLKYVGMFSVAYFLAYTITFIATPIGYILLPTISGCIHRSEQKEAAVYLKYSLKYFFLVGIPVIFGISLLSKEILILFSTTDFLEVRLYLPMLLVGIFIFQAGVLGEYVNMIFGKNTLILIVYIVLTVVNTILNIVLIPKIGAMGAALAMLLSYLCYSIFNLIYSQRFLRFALSRKDFFKVLISALAMTLVIYILKRLFPNINALIFLPIGIILYFILLYASNFFSANETALFKSLLRRKNTADEKI